jgi:FlaA1/EpsC-like NDP-sugar epimerase
MRKHIKQLMAFRRVLLPLGYAVGLILGLWIAYQIRFDFRIPPEYYNQFITAACWIASLQLILLLAFGQVSGHLTVFGIPDFGRLCASLTIGLVAILALRTPNDLLLVPPRSIAIADFVVCLCILAGWRLSMRLAWQRLRATADEFNPSPRRIGIVGAGDVGCSLAREFLIKRHLGLEPVAFFDDDRHIWNSRIHGIPVFGAPEILIEQKSEPIPTGLLSLLRRLIQRDPRSRLARMKLDEIVIAMPSAPARRIRDVVAILQRAGLMFRTVPSLEQIATGAVRINQLRQVEIQDLLGRNPVCIETENICAVLAGKVVMVTGAGGSIGSELCKQIMGFCPEKLLLVEQSEVQLFQIEQELSARVAGQIIPCIADVLDYERMDHLFKSHRPHIVFHAAAHKHVPLMESQPGEAIKNNTLGTAQVAKLAVKHKAERFVLISTDKAINPTNVMGATKRLAEMVVQALHADSFGTTKLMGVRFGNVLGSSGSVIPTFTKQIAAGGPVKVTHPEITRYFMTIPEAVSLVLQSCAQGDGGEIFVLDMGKPVRILDLANEMIRLSGLTPGEDIEIEFVGLRPGEKLFEELCADGENTAQTHHPKIMRFVSPLPQLRDLAPLLADLEEDVVRLSPDELKLRLQKIVPEYKPHLDHFTAPALAAQPTEEEGVAA